ncbi:hypothetical protein ACVWWO_005619 [Bradyrhizobium sp. F1.13.1]
MRNNTFTVNGGAASAATLTIRNLIDEETGEVKMWVPKGARPPGGDADLGRD